MGQAMLDGERDLVSWMRQMEGQEAVFNGSRMGLTIGLLNFIGPVAASTSESCRRYQSLLREGRKEGRWSARTGRGRGVLTVVIHKLIQRELLDLLLLGSWTTNTSARAMSDLKKMMTIPMIAVLNRCWLRATMIEARSQGGRSREQKSCCCWLLLLELLGFGVGFAGAIVCFAVRASPLQAAFQMMRLQRKARSECQKDAGSSWAVRGEEVVTGPVLWVDGEGLSWWSCLDSLSLER